MMVRSGGCARLHLSVDMVLPPREEEPEEPELTVRCIRVVVLSSFARNPVSTINPSPPAGTLRVLRTRRGRGCILLVIPWVCVLRPFDLLSPDFTFYR